MNSLREIYFRELVPLKETQAAAERKAFLEYKANLEAIVAHLTRKGDLEEAIKLRQSIEKLEIPSPPTADEPAEEIVVGKEENYIATPELRIIEPVIIKRNGIPDFRPLDSERIYDLEVRVTDSNISVYANNRKQGEVDGDFSKAEGPIGIGPARGSVVTVERLVGIQQ
ncbi:MAG: hypothetical protein P1U87_16425 [Verrucomicrobiales bacterium]|nr:hypothetical protein [Verrucomicrobiales bacterium]